MTSKLAIRIDGHIDSFEEEEFSIELGQQTTKTLDGKTFEISWMDNKQFTVKMNDIDICSWNIDPMNDRAIGYTWDPAFLIVCIVVTRPEYPGEMDLAFMELGKIHR